MKNCFTNPLKTAIIIYIIFIVIYLVFLKEKFKGNKYLFPIIVITLSVLIYYFCILINFYFSS